MDAPAVVMLAQDKSPTEPPRPIGFAMNLFVREDWMRRERAAPAPGLSARPLREHLAGSPCGASPILSRAQIHRDNARRGLFAVTLHYTLSPGAADPKEMAAVREVGSTSLVAMHRGYLLQELLVEILEAHRPWVTAMGHIPRDAQCSSDPRNLSGSQTERQTYLAGMTRAEAQAMPGSMLSFVFRHTPPLCGFRPKEQCLLLSAMQGLSDAELAQELGLSICTIKKRWQALYARVETALPGLIEENEGAGGGRRRRVLLQYLRDHPEELRPNVA